MLGRQPWSFAGDSGRASVSQLFLDPCIHFNIDTNWFLLTFMILTTNWQADSIKCWTVSLGGGVAGSWVAAIGMLMFGWLVRGTG